MAKRIHTSEGAAEAAGALSDRTSPVVVGGPQFAQPAPTPDPTRFVTPHPSDTAAYKGLDQLAAEHKLRPTAFPVVRGGPEPQLNLAQVLGPAGAAATKPVEGYGQLVFHSVGDTGNVRGPMRQSLVADKMVADFADPDAGDVPQFFFHLGDVIYNFGETAYDHDQFYEPHRDYPAPILALAGNHDGLLRTPKVIQAAGDGEDHVVLESYDDQDYGYLHIVVDARQLRIEYHPAAADGSETKTPDDRVSVDLATRTVVASTVT